MTATSQTQPGLPATSSGDAETRGLSRGAREAKFIRQLGDDFQLRISIPKLLTDSTVALTTSKRLGPGTKLRHLDVAEFYVQAMVREGLATTGKVKGTANPANALTKYLAAKELKEALSWMGMVNLTDSDLAPLLEKAREMQVAGISDEVIAENFMPMAAPKKRMPWKPAVAAVMTAAELLIVTSILATVPVAKAAEQALIPTNSGLEPMTLRAAWSDQMQLALMFYLLICVARDFCKIA